MYAAPPRTPPAVEPIRSAAIKCISGKGDENPLRAVNHGVGCTLLRGISRPGDVMKSPGLIRKISVFLGTFAMAAVMSTGALAQHGGGGGHAGGGGGHGGGAAHF